MRAPRARSSARRAGPRPALRSTRSIRPRPSEVWRARWRRTSASSIGVTGCDRHRRVAVEAVDAVAGAGEERAEGLPAADGRGGDEERRGAAGARGRSRRRRRSSRRAARCRGSSRPCSAGSGRRGRGGRRRSPGSSARIQSGLRVRASPARPTARAPGKRATGLGRRRLEEEHRREGRRRSAPPSPRRSR